LQLHQRLLDAGLDRAVRAALREVPGDDRDEHRQAIQNVGVNSLDGSVAGVAAICCEIGVSWPLLDLLDRLGHGNTAGIASDRSDVFDAVPPLLAASTSTPATPTVAISLGVGFAGRPPEQREDVLRFLADLAMGAEVVLVAGEVVGRRLRVDHSDVLPAHILTSLQNRRRTQDGPAAAEREERVETALGTLNRDARPAAILSALSETSTHSLSYGRLTRQLALDSTPSESLRRLDRDLSLVERTRRADGTRVASLRPAGLDVSRALDRAVASDGGRASAGAASASWASTDASHTPQNPPDMPCYPSDGRGPEDPPDDAAPADARPEDRRERYQHGLIEPTWAPRREWVPAVEATDGGEVLLVDADLALDEDRDGRRPWLSVDAETDTVWVGGEFSNPMQFAALLAHGLLSEEMLAGLDLAGRLGEDLAGLDIKEREVLWSAVCAGWLPSDVDSGDEYVSELRGARDDLLELAKRVNTDDVSRSAVTRQSLGIVGTVVALLDLLGVDVVLEARVPQFSRHFSEDGNPARRDDLTDHLGMLAALTSRVGAFNFFRQVFEGREGHRSDAFTPGFTSGEAAIEGSMAASLVVVGDGVEDLAGDVEEDLAPRSPHSDAPPVGVGVEVVAGAGRRRTASVVRRMLRSRGLRSTRTAVMVMDAFASSPWAAADAIHWGLEREDSRREVHLDEIRRALSTLDAGRLLPSCSGSARAGVAALLAADGPLSQAELARRAGISTESWRNHRGGLVDLDVVREVENGWRVALPRRDERHDGPDVSEPPWWLQDDDGHRPATDVLWWLLDADDDLAAVDHALEVGVDGVPRSHVDRGAAVDALDALGVPPDLVLAGVDAPARAPPTGTARLGPDTRQSTLPI